MVDEAGYKSQDRSMKEGVRPKIHRQLFRRRKVCPFCEKGAPKIDYKDTRLLQRYISERGKILPRRISFVSSAHQRELAQAIKRARHLALLPYVVQ